MTSHLSGPGTAEAQSCPTLSGLLHLLYDRAGCGGHDPFLHNSQNLSFLLFRLLDQTVGHVQDSAMVNYNIISVEFDF